MTGTMLACLLPVSDNYNVLIVIIGGNNNKVHLESF